MACHWCVGPYLYPGLRGSPYNPIPSEWPSPHLVVDTCCHVFNTQGRTMRVYRESLNSIGPRLGRDDIATAYPCDMVGDLRALCVHLIHNHCMWLPSPGDVPEPYTLGIVGQFFGQHKVWAHRANTRACDLLVGDPVFQSLASASVDQLNAAGFSVKLNGRKV